MKDFTNSLLSRKLIIAVVSLAYFLLHNDPTHAAEVVLGYFGANAVESYSNK